MCQITEFLEVIINQVLYLRGVYPSQIFKKLKVNNFLDMLRFPKIFITQYCSQVYSLPVFISLYPPLNTYIKDVLMEMSTLLMAKKLKKVEVRLNKSDNSHESYFLDINSEKTSEDLDDDLETEFRSCIHSLDIQCKSSKKLSKVSSFKIFLHVTSYDYKSDSRCQDFLWVEDNDSSKTDTSEIIPINMTSPSNIVKFYLER